MAVRTTMITLAGLFLSLVQPDALAETVSPPADRFQYSGRWNFDNPAQTRVSWQGPTMRFAFDGTAFGNSYAYQVCETGGGNCSEEQTVNP